MRTERRDGFTLVEILVALAVVGILVVLAAAAGFRNVQRSRQAEAMVEMRDINTAISLYATTNGRYPKTIGAATTETRADPWGHAYSYSSDGNSFELRCLGRDGAPSAGISRERRDDFDLDIVMRDGQFTNRPFD